MRREITLEERKDIQLEMLSEIEKFCTENNIHYSLACGTLIGAIRHKGFIPWDDDVDIMFPLPDLLKFRDCFKSEKLEYYDIDNTYQYDDAFSHIAYKPTYKKIGLNSRSFGVNIDVYPIVAFPDSDDDIEQLLANAKAAQKKRINYINFKYTYILRFWPFKRMPYLPFYEKTVRNYQDILFKAAQYGKTNHYWMVGGPLIKNDWLYDFDLFSHVLKVPFENITVSITSEYDRFLSRRYGDYMKLPPEDQRVPYHTAHYFWK